MKPTRRSLLVFSFLLSFGILVHGPVAKASAPLCAAIFTEEKAPADGVNPVEELARRQGTDLRAVELETIAVLDKVVFPKGHLDVAGDVRTWLDATERRQNTGERLSMIEHSALTYLLKIDFFGRAGGDPAFTARAQAVLERSWNELTGNRPLDGDLLQELPTDLTLRANREERLFLAAVQQPDNPRLVQAPPKWKLAARFGAVTLIPVTLAALGLHDLASAAGGLVVATIAEWVIHKHGGHASDGLLQIFSKAGRFGELLRNMKFSHSDIHHSGTYKRQYTEQFSSPEEQAELDEELMAMGHVGEDIIERRYGLTIHTVDMIEGMFVAAPVHMTLIWTLGLGPVSSAFLVAPSLLYGMASKYMHPALHDARPDALAEAKNSFERMILKSRYAEMMSRLHYMHHRGGVTGNYNLIFGADWLLGTLYRPSLRSVLQMRKLGLVGATWEDKELGR